MLDRFRYERLRVTFPLSYNSQFETENRLVSIVRTGNQRARGKITLYRKYMYFFFFMRHHRDLREIIITHYREIPTIEIRLNYISMSFALKFEFFVVAESPAWEKPRGRDARGARHWLLTLVQPSWNAGPRDSQHYENLAAIWARNAIWLMRTLIWIVVCIGLGVDPLLVGRPC